MPRTPSRSEIPSELRSALSALRGGQAKLWILLVSVHHYDDPRLPSLPYAAIDCQNLAYALTQATRSFPERTIAIHHDLASRPPTLSAVRESLQEIAEYAQPQDTVLFYFCGHGALEPRLQQAVLCLADTQKDALLKTGMSAIALLGALGNCKARQQVVWLDTCHSDNVRHDGSTHQMLDRLDDATAQLIEILYRRAAQHPGFDALLSCDNSQQSWKFPELGHGVFTHYLVQGLQGEAANAQGIIDTDGLCDYVYSHTLQYVNQRNQKIRFANQHKQDWEEQQLEYTLQKPKRVVKSSEKTILGVVLAERSAPTAEDGSNAASNNQLRQTTQDSIKPFQPDIVESPLPQSLIQAIAAPVVQEPSAPISDKLTPSSQDLVDNRLEQRQREEAERLKLDRQRQENERRLQLQKAAEEQRQREEAERQRLQLEQQRLHEQKKVKQLQLEQQRRQETERRLQLQKAAEEQRQREEAERQRLQLEQQRQREEREVERLKLEQQRRQETERRLQLQKAAEEQRQREEIERQRLQIEQQRQREEAERLRLEQHQREEAERQLQLQKASEEQRQREETERLRLEQQRLREQEEAERLRLEQQRLCEEAERQRLQLEEQRQREEREAERLQLLQEAAEEERQREEAERQRLQLEEQRQREEREAERLRLEQHQREEAEQQLQLQEAAEEERQRKETERLQLEQQYLRQQEEAERLRLQAAEEQRLREETERQLEQRQREEAEQLQLQKAAEEQRQREETERLQFEQRQREQEEAERHKEAAKEQRQRQRTQKASNIKNGLKRFASDTSQHSTTAVGGLKQSAERFTHRFAEQQHSPQTRKIILFALAGSGLLACGMAASSFYQQRNAQLRDIRALSATSEKLSSANQSQAALVVALQMGHRLQQLDRPWNLLPEPAKISAIATLQQAILRSQTPPQLGQPTVAIAYSSDRQRLATASPEGAITLWNKGNDGNWNPATTLSGHSAAVTQLQFSPDGNLLASASTDKTIKLWNIEKGILVKTLPGHRDRVTAIRFRSDGGVLASGSADQTIKLWTIPTGNLVETLKAGEAAVSAIDFSTDGRILATGSSDNTLRLWYPESNQPILLGRHNEPPDPTKFEGITSVRFSPDGKAIASAGWDTTIKLWTVSDGKPEREASPYLTLNGHSQPVSSISFNADGQILASGSQDKTIKLWNLRSGAVIKTLFGHQDPVESVSFNAKESTLTSVSDRNGLITWDLNLTNLMKQGCNQLRQSPQDISESDLPSQTIREIDRICSD